MIFFYLILLVFPLLLNPARVDQKSPSPGPPVPSHRSMPAYPQLALIHKVSGAVLVDVMVNVDGRVTEVTMVSGPELLRNAAKKAAWVWQFEPPKTPFSVRLTFIFHEPTFLHPAREPDFTSPYQIEVERLAAVDDFNFPKKKRR